MSEEKKTESLLRDLLIIGKVSQAELARRLGESPPLMSYWAKSNSSTAIHLGSILKVIDVPPEKLHYLVRKYLS